jgi:hypothetical protein
MFVVGLRHAMALTCDDENRTLHTVGKPSATDCATISAGSELPPPPPRGCQAGGWQPDVTAPRDVDGRLSMH